jgi:dTDP-4-dehydrorhamnose reductase
MTETGVGGAAPGVDRVLIVGDRGQLGTDLTEVVTTAGREVTGRDYPAVDITDFDSVRDLVGSWATAVSGARLAVVNCAAWTDVDGAEEKEAAAHAVNAVGPAHLARACAQAGAALVHISTDYVFDGTGTSPYAEDDRVAPRSAYGRTKAAGERALLDELPSAYVVRTAWLYGAGGNNFVKTMIRLAGERDSLQVVDDQRGAPTWSKDLARGLLALLDAAPQAGIYHYTNSGETTWCGFARAILAAVGADPGKVQPTTTDAYPRPAPRPAYSVLSHRRWLAAGLPAPPPWEESLRAALAEQPAAFGAS